MTQEELDAIMSGDMDLDAFEEEPAAKPSKGVSKRDSSLPDNLPDDAHWPPPAPVDDNKMVNQLDDVTRESEEKSTAIFDIIDGIGRDLQQSESTMQEVLVDIQEVIGTLKVLNEKFPRIMTFETHLHQMEATAQKIDAHIDMLQNNGDQVMNAMDIMQYQDIHRQKIERVINVMRALSKYMNTLFSSSKDDTKRVSSATHIHGDTTTEDVMSNDDIEALLSSFGQESA
ncbi:MAG: chemotaxis protein [Sulfurovum sp. PC08-66]|nr:MAG: chemotaxis protein [Sulfurovum sp. PC08-66]KIM12513.1 MAG: chemotaxis protein [Sulfuricurvum sp. PC08-66]